MRLDFSGFVSVIVPIYNAEQYLYDCIESIRNQTYSKLDIILIDDGSTDESPQICDYYSKIDTRITVIHQENRGLVYSRKVGIKKARGEYITFVDSDDYIDVDLTERILNEIDENRPDIIAFGLIEDYGSCSLIKINNFDSGAYYDKKLLYEKIYPQMLSCGQFFEFGMLPNLVCKFIGAKFLKEADIKVSDEVVVGEDADLTYQLMACANSVYVSDISGYHYRKHSGSMMQSQISFNSINMLEQDLITCFCREGIFDVMCRQLEQYITFVKLLKAPDTISYICDLFEKRNDRIALYGAGGFGKSLVSTYSERIMVWVDREYENYSGKFKEIQPPSDLLTLQDKYDCIFIAILNENICEDIKAGLICNGIKKDILYFKSER